MTKMVDVIYNKEFISLMSSLSSINDKFVMRKSEGDSIRIESKNKEASVAYLLKAPVDSFNFNGDAIAFYRYSEFKGLLDVFQSPTLKQDEEKFEIKQDKSKITYYLADTEAIPNTFKKMKFENPDVVFTLSKEEFVHLEKMIRLLNSELVTFDCKDGKLLVRLSGDDKDSSYEKTYEITSNTLTSDMVLSIPKDIFSLAPKSEYEIQLKKEGIIKFVYKNVNGFDLDLYTAENDKD